MGEGEGARPEAGGAPRGVAVGSAAEGGAAKQFVGGLLLLVRHRLVERGEGGADLAGALGRGRGPLLHPLQALDRGPALALAPLGALTLLCALTLLAAFRPPGALGTVAAHQIGRAPVCTTVTNAHLVCR